jgi:hypothetical protein
VEKKVTEGPSRVGIIVRVLDNQGTDRSTHRIWPSEALVLMDPRGYLRRQTGVAVRLLFKRAPCNGLRKNYPRFFCLGASCQKTPGDPNKRRGSPEACPGRSIVDTSLCYLPLPLYGGGLLCGSLYGIRSGARSDTCHLPLQADTPYPGLLLRHLFFC